MKIIVDRMPSIPAECLFADHDLRYNVFECRLSCGGGYECEDTSKCPYLKVENVEDDIVRCKDCIYYNADFNMCLGDHPDKAFHTPRTLDDFCGDGRRKDKEK